jgi:hypothetical protein|tara:strand:- start:1117 stop:1773 length:657 start_codon:yes stop_codon:yes gene_type:complete
MKLSEQTIEVLQNFSTINQSLLFKSGDVLRTVSPQKTVLAEVTVPDNFESEFGIYDLGQFLSAMTLIDDAELNLGDNSMNINNGNGMSITYRYADPSMIVTPPEKGIALPDIDAEFSLSDTILKNVLQAARVLGLPDIIVEGDGTNISISAGDSKNSSMNNYSQNIVESDSKFRHVFKVDNMKMMMLQYNVEISTKGISKFYTEDGNATYYIATESRS